MLIRNSRFDTTYATYRDSIKLIDYTWLHDVSEAQADAWVIEYGVGGQP